VSVAAKRQYNPAILPFSRLIRRKIIKIVEVKPSLVKHKIGLMREHGISTKRFRELAAEVGSLITYEDTADLEMERATVEGWCGPVEVDQLKGKKLPSCPFCARVWA